MRVVIATDKFKGFASASQMAEMLARELDAVVPHADVVSLPVADGGQGTLDALAGMADEVWCRTVEDAWGDPVDAQVLSVGDEVWVEMAQTAGVGSRSGPAAALTASTYGTGLLLERLRDAAHVFVAVGGTLTSDGGTGLATALGWRFVDDRGDDVARGGRGLAEIARIASGEPPGFEVTAACDVMAPLLGPRGAARRFAPQKGADEDGIALLERGLENLADVVERTLDLDVREVAGGGAGGGSGAGLAAFLGARLRRGFDLVASRIDLDGAVASADLVITGEGSFDEQTLEGKAPIGVLEVARRHGVPCALIAGRIATDPRAVGYTAAAELDEGLEAAVRSLVTDP